MTWIRLKRSFTNKKGRKIPIGQKWNMIAVQAEEWVKSGKAEYCNRDDAKVKTEFFNPK